MGKSIHKIESSFLHVKRNKSIWILKHRYRSVKVDTGRLFRSSMTEKQKQILLFFFLCCFKGCQRQSPSTLTAGGGAGNLYENCQVRNVILI